jgi:hypothetical protein
MGQKEYFATKITVFSKINAHYYYKSSIGDFDGSLGYSSTTRNNDTTGQN